MQLSRSTVLNLSYVGNFGRKENRLRNANQGIFTGFDASGKAITLFPYPNLNSSQNTLAGNHAFLELATNDGNTNYNGLLVSLTQRFARGLAYGLNYTFSKNFSDYVDNLTGGSTPETAYNYSLERSFSPFDVAHRFVAYGTWDLPVGKGKALLDRGGVANQVAGGWQVNTIVTLETGTPFTVTAPDNSANRSQPSKPGELYRRSLRRRHHRSLAVCGRPRAGVLHQSRGVRHAGSAGRWVPARRARSTDPACRMST